MRSPNNFRMKVSVLLACLIALSCVGSKGESLGVGEVSLEDTLANCKECSNNKDTDKGTQYEDEYQEKPFKREYGLVTYDPQYSILGNSRWRTAIHKAVTGGPNSWIYKYLNEQFFPWKGKRNQNRKIAIAETSEKKRERIQPSFSSWGGKRTSKFHSWGGKRSITEEFNAEFMKHQLNQLIDDINNTVMKRKIAINDEKNIENVANNKRKKRSVENLCIKKNENMSLEELFNAFMKLSSKRPEEKKDKMYRRLIKMNTLHSLGESGGNSNRPFFQWGGKRNSEHSRYANK